MTGTERWILTLCRHSTFILLGGLRGTYFHTANLGKWMGEKMLNLTWEVINFQVPLGILGIMYSMLNFYSWYEILVCFDKTLQNQRSNWRSTNNKLSFWSLFFWWGGGQLQRYHMTFLTWVLLIQDCSWSILYHRQQSVDIWALSKCPPHCLSKCLSSLFLCSFPLKSSVFSVFVDKDGSFPVP